MFKLRLCIYKCFDESKFKRFNNLNEKNILLFTRPSC